MKSFDKFRISVSSKKEEFPELSNYDLAELEESDYVQVRDKAESLFLELDVMKTKAKIVANSKLMHFILPDFIMPVDRLHTLKFLYDRKSGNFVSKFANIFEFTHDMAMKGNFQKYLDDGWNQSVPKVIDSAIVGYVEMEMK